MNAETSGESPRKHSIERASATGNQQRENPKIPSPITAALALTQEPGERNEIPLVPWEALAGGHEQLRISFQGMVYQLRVTRNGKLILTK